MEIPSGILIERVEEGSIAHDIGLACGDRLLAVGESLVEDALDYHFLVSNAGGEVRLKICKADGEIWDVDIERDEDEEIGLELEAIKTRTCTNNCLFCFVHQLPRGKHVRRTLRVKDEDFRLSFLHGNYLTLTNASEADFERILRQRLSPLYISVHATEPELRQKILRSRGPGHLLEQLKRLASGGITLHTQIVLLPGLNDGAHLERSIQDLLELHPALQSVAIVPVGLTGHRQGLYPLTPVDAGYAAKAIDIVTGWQRQIQKSKGTPFCYLGDEFYILADRPIPGRRHYGNFPVIENGVGMVRRFLEEFRLALRRSPKPGRKRIKGTLVTGRLFYPILRQAVEEMNARFKLDLKCLAASSLFLGNSITVAGLLAGNDIYEAAKNRLHGDFLMVPSETMIGDNGLFLDDWQRKDLEARLHVPIIGSGYHVSEFFNAIFSQAPAR